MSQLSPSPRYQSDIKFRWCPTVDCRGITKVLLVLTSVTGTQIDLLWRDDLGWYESELCRLPFGLHTAIIVLNIKVYDENWKCISREKQFKVDTFHIVSHKFAIELFLDNNEEISFLSDTPTLRHRYLSSDNLDYTGKEWKTDTNDSEDFNYMYHSTPDLKFMPHNKNDKDFDHTLNAVKFLSNRVKSLGLSTNAGTQEKLGKSPLFDKCDRNSFVQNKENQNNRDLQITEYDTLSINLERDITKKKEILMQESVFEYTNYSEISASDESDTGHVSDGRNEDEYDRKKAKKFNENTNEDDQNSSCNLITQDNSVTYNKQTTILTTFTNEKDFSKENLSNVKTDSTFTLKKLKNKSINKTIDLDDDNNFHYDSLKGEDAAFHIDIKNINESDSDDGLSGSYRRKGKGNENLFSFNNSVEKLNLDRGNEITYMNYEDTSNFNNGINACDVNCIYNNDENVDKMDSKEAINTAYVCNISKNHINDHIESYSLEVDHLPKNINNKSSDQTNDLTEVTSNLENQENDILEVDESSFHHYKASLCKSSESVKSNISNHANCITETKIKKDISLSQIKKQSESPENRYEKKTDDLFDKDFYTNGVKDTFEYTAKFSNKDSPLCDDMGVDFKGLREASNSVRLKKPLLPDKLNVSYSRQSNRSKFPIPSTDYKVQHNLASLQRNLYSRCSPKIIKEMGNSSLNSPSFYNSNKMTLERDRHKFKNDSILRNKNLCVNDISRNVWNDNLMPYKTRNEIYKSTVDKTPSPKKIGSRDLYSNHKISERSFQPNNALYQKSIHGTRSKLSNFTNCNRFGGSLNNLHEYPPQQNFSSRLINDSFSDSKRRKVSSFPDLRQKENFPYKSIKYSERRLGSQNFNLYSENEHTRYGADVYKPLGDLDGSGDSTESLLDEADKVLKFSLKG